MRASKWLIADDPHPAYDDWDARDGLHNRPKVTVRMGEYPRLVSEPVHPTPPEGKVLPKTHDDSKAPFLAATGVLIGVGITLVWTVANLLIAGAL